MALVQTFPEFSCEKLVVSKAEELQLHDPLYVPFKRGASVERVVRLIKSARTVILDAAPAAGKTTVLPQRLASDTGTLVILVLPYEHLSYTVYDYLVTTKKVADVSYMAEVSDSFPRTGLVVTYAGLLVAKWITHGKVIMPECYLLHDEAHESGAATAAIRALGAVDSRVKSYVRMSATADAGEVRPLLFDGQLVRRTYSAAEYADPWDLEEDGTPWAEACFAGRTLIFEDDGVRAANLFRAYTKRGVTVMRWHAGTSGITLVEEIKKLNATTDGPVVIIADSSFRSGFTLPVTTIIDSGKIRRVVCGAEGKPELFSRDIYEAECIQSASRGGRIAGLRTIYWRPDIQLKCTIALLEQADLEALAVIFAVLGYKMPDYMGGTQAANGLIPVRVHQALSGKVPIACLTGDDLCSLHDFATCGIQQSEKAGAGTKAQTVADSAGISSEWVDRLRADLQGMTVDGTSDERNNPVFVLGNYLAADDLYDSRAAITPFPDGLASVMRILADADVEMTVASWDGGVRSEAVEILLDAYNSRVMQMRGGAMAVRLVSQRRAEKHAGAMRVWSVRVAENVSQLTLEAQRYMNHLAVVARGHFRLYEPDLDMVEQEDKCCGIYIQEFDKLPAAVVSSRPRVNAAHMRSVSVPTITAAAYGGVGVRALISDTSGSVNRGLWDGEQAPNWYTRRIARITSGSSESDPVLKKDLK